MQEATEQQIEAELERAVVAPRPLRQHFRSTTAIPVPPKPSPTIEDLLDTREATHGNYTDTAAHAQALKYIMMETPGWKKLSAVQAESLQLIATKIARILSGDPNQAEHWDDIGGYSKLVSERLRPR